MEIAEPMTMVTDYIITVYTFILGILLFFSFSFDESPSVWYIAIVLIVTGIGAFLGGTAHGFKPSLSENAHNKIWKGTTMSIGFASLFFVLAVIFTSIANQTVQILFVIITLAQFFFYLYWVNSHNEFIYVIINYLVSMGIVIALKIYSYFSFSDESSSWVIGSIIISIIASAIQAKGIGIHPKYFNHNDLFHVVQLPGFYLLYKAAFYLVQL